MRGLGAVLIIGGALAAVALVRSSPTSTQRRPAGGGGRTECLYCRRELDPMMVSCPSCGAYAVETKTEILWYRRGDEPSTGWPSWAPAAVVVGVLVVVGLAVSAGSDDTTENSGDARTADASTTVPGSAFVDRQSFEAGGRTWPLLVDSGTLYCNGGAVTFESGGTRYGVNGTALGQGYPRIDRIWAPAPEGLGLKVNIGDLLDHGRSLC